MGNTHQHHSIQRFSCLKNSAIVECIKATLASNYPSVHLRLKTCHIVPKSIANITKSTLYLLNKFINHQRHICWKNTLWHLDDYMDEHSKLITSNNFNTIFLQFVFHFLFIL